MRAASTRSASSRLLSSLIAVWLAGAFAVFAFAGARSFGVGHWAGVLVAAAVAVCAAWVVWNGRVVPLEERAATPALRVVFVLAAVLSLVQLTRLCVFVVNPAEVGYAVGPHGGLGLPPRHLCMTAYFVAAQSVRRVPNVYEYTLYAVPPESPNALRTPRTLGQFDVDAYEYPPPFLLLPRAVAMATPQFLDFRMLWFALYGAVVLAGLVAVTRTFEPATGTRALLLTPLVLGAEITIGTLQAENIQAAVVVLAMLAMLLFRGRQYAAGGALLAFATVSKMFPGALIVYLAVRREWRALLWTLGLACVLVGVSFLDTGRAAYSAFAHQLPRLLSGEAFPALQRPGAIAINLSVPGLLLKLNLFGLPGGSFTLMKLVGTIYSLILLAAVVVIARRRPGRDEEPLIWLAILMLGSLRSPFLPQYGLFPVLWLLILLAARAAPTLQTLSLTLAAWVVLNISLPVFNGPDPRWVAAFVLVSQGVMIALLVLALRRRGESYQQSGVVMQPELSPS